MWAYYNKSGEIICDKMYDELGPVIDKCFGATMKKVINIKFIQ